MATTLQHHLPPDVDISRFIEESKSRSQMSGDYNIAGQRPDAYRAFSNSEERNMERKKHIGDERKHDYQQFLAKKERDKQLKRENFLLTNDPPAPAKKNDWYSAEEYERMRNRLKDERQKEYNELMSKQRNRPTQRKFKTPTIEDNQLLYLGQYERKQKQLADLRKKECIEYSEQAQQRASEPPRREPWDKGDNPHGFVDNLGAYDRERNLINQERQRDYNLFLDQKFSSNSKPLGRPNFVKGKEIQESNDLHMERQHYYRNPGGNPGPSRAPQKAISSVSQTYAELLQQKRRQEACYRQNDPSYQRSDEMPDMQQSTASFPRTE